MVPRYKKNPIVSLPISPESPGMLCDKCHLHRGAQRDNSGGEAKQYAVHAAHRAIIGAITGAIIGPSSPISTSLGEYRDTKAGTTQSKDLKERTPCVGPS